MKKICRLCGKEFETKIFNRETCAECVEKLYPIIKNTVSSDTCIICGKKIQQAGSRPKKYCSRKCGDIALTIIQMGGPKKKVKKTKAVKKKNTKKNRYKIMDKLEMAARKLGMDYGTYTAMLRMNK